MRAVKPADNYDRLIKSLFWIDVFPDFHLFS
jgi:hypothetical protein